MFEIISNEDLIFIDGGFDLGAVYAGFVSGCIGVGLLAVAATPGLNIVAAAGAAYVASWGLAGGVTLITYGCVA